MPNLLPSNTKQQSHFESYTIPYNLRIRDMGGFVVVVLPILWSI
jgi:hypothetical protein